MSITTEHLEKFVEDCQPELEAIKTSLSAFNIFNVLGIQYREIRHSNFLGWLFDPNESHQLGAVFLRDLLRLLRKVEAIRPDTLIDLLLQDLTKTQVFRESINNIDIFISNEELGFVICIENKIHTSYSTNQLKKYHNYIEENYSDYKIKAYLTLTPFKNVNHINFDKGEEYKNISYQNIVEILKTNNGAIKKALPTVKESINQYIAMIEKSIIHSSEEVKLAQKIYRKYKKEIDFIVSNKPDFYSQKDAVINAINNGELGNFEIIGNDYHNDIIRILPEKEALLSVFKDPDFNSWGGEYIFCLELFVQKNHIWLKWCFGDIRNEIKKEECQQKKTRLVTAMKAFDCFKESGLKIDFHRGNPEDDYTGLCGITLFHYDAYINQQKPFLELLKEKLDLVHKKLIEPWSIESIQKL